MTDSRAFPRMYYHAATRLIRTEQRPTHPRKPINPSRHPPGSLYFRRLTLLGTAVIAMTTTIGIAANDNKPCAASRLPLSNKTTAVRNKRHLFNNTTLVLYRPRGVVSRQQVYKASIGGRAVAVKVQRPDLLEAVALDFYLARGIAATVMRLSQSPMFFGGRVEVRSDLVAAVDEYGSRLFEELDYRKEVYRRPEREAEWKREGGETGEAGEESIYVLGTLGAVLSHYRCVPCSNGASLAMRGREVRSTSKERQDP